MPLRRLRRGAFRLFWRAFRYHSLRIYVLAQQVWHFVNTAHKTPLSFERRELGTLKLFHRIIARA
jgi:hypothetical protein